MLTIRRHSNWILVGLIVSLVAVGGCGEEKIVITQFPAWYQGQVKTIAVAPFRNASGYDGAGNIISDALAAQLTANGTYTVYNRSNLNMFQNEQDLRTELGMDNKKLVAALRKNANVEAVLIGTVNIYSATERREQRTRPIYQYNQYTKQNQIVGQQPYVFTRNDANVTVSAELIRISDGRPIASTAQPATGHVWAQGSPPQYDKNACLNGALQNAIAQLVSTFAVTRQVITVKPSKDFRTAKSLYDGEWDYEDKFLVSETQASVVLRLPPSCDRNRFRVAIVRKDSRRTLYDKEFVWSKKNSQLGMGLPFDPSQIAKEGGGRGEYEAKFYAGPKPVMKHSFRIE